jgi:hypothetical protein
LGRSIDDVSSLLADVAESTLRNMEANEKISRLVRLQGEALTQALKEPANAYLVREYIGCKLNALARTPVVLAVKLASLGLPAYLCTTFATSIILQETNLVRWVAMRAAREPTIVFPLNDVINEIMERAGRPKFGLDTTTPSFMDSWLKLQEQADEADVSISEREALRLIREHAYQRVTVHIDGGQIVQIDTHEDVPVTSEKAVSELIKTKAYQTVEIVVRDGKVAVLRRKTVTKVPSGNGRHPNR